MIDLCREYEKKVGYQPAEMASSDVCINQLTTARLESHVHALCIDLRNHQTQPNRAHFLFGQIQVCMSILGWITVRDLAEGNAADRRH